MLPNYWKYYLSGPITNADNPEGDFCRIEEKLRDWGYEDVVNPVFMKDIMNPDLTTRQEYLGIDFALMDLCKVVIQLPGWEESFGSWAEYGYAKAKGISTITLKEFAEEYGKK